MSIEDFSMDAIFDAEVTLRVRIANLCTREDLAVLGMTFEEFVKQEIRENGIWGLVDAEPVVIGIKVWQS